MSPRQAIPRCDLWPQRSTPRAPASRPQAPHRPGRPPPAWRSRSPRMTPPRFARATNRIGAGSIVARQVNCIAAAGAAERSGPSLTIRRAQPSRPRLERGWPEKTLPAPTPSPRGMATRPREPRLPEPRAISPRKWSSKASPHPWRLPATDAEARWDRRFLQFATRAATGVRDELLASGAGRPPHATAGLVCRRSSSLLA